MSSIVLECPYCGAEKVGFTLACGVRSSLTPPQVAKRTRYLMLCSNCEEAIVGVLDLPRGRSVSLEAHECTHDPTKAGYVLAAFYPKPACSRCPEHTPEVLERLFLQASNALKRGDADASGAMSRKVLDNSTQQLLAEDAAKDRTINARIDALAEKGMLTSELAQWAHEIRLSGNDAVHDLDPYTIDEAGELLTFVELYLTYIYTLPGRLEERRRRRAEK